MANLTRLKVLRALWIDAMGKENILGRGIDTNRITLARMASPKELHLAIQAKLGPYAPPDLFDHFVINCPGLTYQKKTQVLLDGDRHVRLPWYFLDSSAPALSGELVAVRFLDMVRREAYVAPLTKVARNDFTSAIIPMECIQRNG